MKRMVLSVIGILVVLFLWLNDSLMAQDKFELKAPNGISFSEIRGYETWPFIAPSWRTDNNELRVILGNTAMVNSYQAGIPGNGKPFSEGSIIVKIAWSERISPVFPPAHEPDVLKRVEFIVKDTKGFPPPAAGDMRGSSMMQRPQPIRRMERTTPLRRNVINAIPW